MNREAIFFFLRNGAAAGCILPKIVCAPFQISNDDHPKYRDTSANE